MADTLPKMLAYMRAAQGVEGGRNGKRERKREREGEIERERKRGEEGGKEQVSHLISACVSGMSGAVLLVIQRPTQTHSLHAVNVAAYIWMAGCEYVLVVFSWRPARCE